MAIEVSPFYAGLPHSGRALNLQWTMFRNDFDALAPIVRAAYVDKAETSGNDDLAGLAFGELHYRNRYRVFYDKSADELKWQWNSGTEGAASWNDIIRVRDSDGRVIVDSSGGLQSTAGFYMFDYLTIAAHGVSGGYEKSTVSKISANYIDGFYWTDDSHGRPVLNLGGVVRPSYTVYPELSDVLIFDGTDYREARLDPADFYISTGGDGKWIISIR